MNITLEIVAIVLVVAAVYAICKRDVPTATAATAGIIVLALLAIMRGGDEHRRDY